MMNEKLHRLTKKIEFSIFNKFQSAPQRVLINSIPKAGTHLLSSMLSQLPGLTISLDLTHLDKFTSEEDRLDAFRSKIKSSPKGIWLGHIPYTRAIDQVLEELSIPVIFIYRDPRDIVVSLLHYVKNNDRHIYYDLLSDRDFSSAMEILIKGYGNGEHHYELSNTSIPSLANYINAYTPWLESQNCLSLSYEGLIGAEQGKNLAELCAYLNLNHSVTKLLKRGIGSVKSSTLREGKIKTWPDEISPEMLREIHEQTWTENSLKTFYNG